MYLNFYHLAKEPFHVTPDPEFLFLSDSHKQALAAIIYGVKQRKGFVTITGPVGAGKTTILRTFLKQSDPAKLKVIYVFDPAVPFSTLVANLCREFDVTPAPDDVPRMTEMLYLALAEQYSKGCTVVLVIDEAQNMPVKTLESLRMLSNFETTEDKLLQIVLAGQPELEELLKTPSLDPLRQRRAIRSVISPLTRKESVSYIKYRLSKAGAADTAIFSNAALQVLARQAEGIPRVINMLCGNALATGYGYQKTRIDAAIAREVINDMGGRRRSPFGKWALITAAAALAGLCVAGAILLDLSPRAVFSRTGALLLDLSPRAVFSRHERQPVLYPAAVQAPAQPAAAAPKDDARPENAVRQQRAGPNDTVAGGVVRVVKRGDTMIDLIYDVYGARESRRIDFLLGKMRESNPFIKNPNLILIGQEIFFPDIKHPTMEAQR
jgi:general secretion pathway protein A